MFWSRPRSDLFLDPSSMPELDNTPSATRAKMLGYGAVVLAALSALSYATVEPHVVPLTDTEGCTSTPPRQVAVLLDASDLWSVDQLRALKASVRRHLASLAAGEKLSLYLLSPEGTESVVETLFSGCKPKPPEDANALTENRRLVAKTYAARWTEPVTAALERLTKQGPPATSSPLLEAFYALGEQPGFTSATVTELEVWSDLLQKSTTLDQFSRCMPYMNFAESGSVYAQVPALHGVAVRVYRLKNRHERYQTVCQSEFWAAYFAQSTGVAAVVQPL